MRENRVIPVIAVNGRGHYPSSKPKDPTYRRRGAIERFFSLMKIGSAQGVRKSMIQIASVKESTGK